MLKLEISIIDTLNKKSLKHHERGFEFLKEELTNQNIDIEKLIGAVTDFQVAVPSWALGAGGTRFGRFAMGGEPRNLEEKIQDVGLLHALNNSSGAISLHIPWDIPDDSDAVKQLADEFNIQFDAVNSNTFQDQADQQYSYKYGSLSHTKKEVRNQAIQHNLEVVKYGEQLGSKALTVWLADGSNFPGQQNFGRALQRTLDSLTEIYAGLPEDWTLLIEYKPYEPNFYSMVIPDWGTSFMLASKIGERAKTLVDLGHHLPNTNIEQIVSILLTQHKLGGFHFNDSKYGDDDLTTGSIKPYQLFLIFNELVEGTSDSQDLRNNIAWMIDASHNVKDPLEDLLQSVEAINQAYVKALLVDRSGLEDARYENDPARAQDILQRAYQTDVRPIIRESRHRNNAALNPLDAYREMNVRNRLIDHRGSETVATGL